MIDNYTLLNLKKILQAKLHQYPIQLDVSSFFRVLERSKSESVII